MTDFRVWNTPKEGVLLGMFNIAMGAISGIVSVYQVSDATYYICTWKQPHDEDRCLTPDQFRARFGQCAFNDTVLSN